MTFRHRHVFASSSSSRYGTQAFDATDERWSNCRWQGLPESGIANLSIQSSYGLRTLASGPRFALLSTFVPALSNTLLVQLVKFPFVDRYSLYAVYREGGVTFDAFARFDIGDQTGSVAEVLEAYVQTAHFMTAVLVPIGREVERHFDC